MAARFERTDARADQLSMAAPARARTVGELPNRRPLIRQPERLLAKLGAVGFWGTLVSLIVGAAASAGLALLFLLPLLGLAYLLFCLIALTADRNVG
ncbi:MAG TPA: hypothetical protein VG073_10995 [Gaiellaceae bacterium]|jgi:hypothetical protein|nr:hypothetical protein [Gaiellaceae bacterium]